MTSILETIMGVQPMEFEPQTADEIEQLTAAYHEIRDTLTDELTVDLHGQMGVLMVLIEFTALGAASLKQILELADRYGFLVSVRTFTRTSDGLTMQGAGRVIIGPEPRVKVPPAAAAADETVLH